MQILIISDIHANLTALQAVLSNAGEIDSAWCLGDLLGYGPDPNECIECIRQLPNLVCLIGNHDAAVLNLIDTDAFNPEARQTIVWTQNALLPENETFLKSLPNKIQIDNVTLAHGSPRQPIWEYLLDSYTATRNFDYFDTDFCFVGHTHLPFIFHLKNDQNNASLTIPTPNKKIELSPRAILNAGSVGQPRDRDPRAAYAIFDPDQQTWDYRRVTYEIADVQKRMNNAGLPSRHIQRLSSGW
ncbi:MAG: metallophosphoesterase family protein [Anaerolineales bacterium]|nr:metallophosphoesterase family protein [Anaerolineales bacterium]